MYKLLPLPSIFSIDEVHLAYVIMGRSHEIEEAVVCCKSAKAKLPEGAYYVDFAEEAAAILKVFTESVFSLETVVAKNYMGLEASQQMFDYFGCEELGLLAVAAYVSEEAPWKDFCKLVDRMSAEGASGMVVCCNGEEGLTTSDGEALAEGLDDGPVKERLLAICEFFEEKEEMA